MSVSPGRTSVDLEVGVVDDAAIRFAGWPTLTLIQQVRNAATPGPAGGTALRIRSSVRTPGLFAAHTLSATVTDQVPSCLVPIHPARRPSPSELVDQIRELSPDTLLGDLDSMSVPRGWQPAERDPRRWLHSYASMLEDSWSVVRSQWSTADQALGRESRRVGAAVITGNAEVLLNHLHPRITCKDGVVSFACQVSNEVAELGPRKLLLVPVLADRSKVFVDFGSPDAALICYPIGHLVAAGDRAADPREDDLATLIGKLRARVLRACDRPVAMTDLARKMLCANSTATYHCANLVDIGLLSRHQVGTNVYVRRTERAEHLMDIMDSGAHADA